MSSPSSLYSLSSGSIDQIKVAELKEDLKTRGLSLDGVKKELIERIKESMKNEKSQDGEGVSNDVHLHDETESTKEEAFICLHKEGPQHGEEETVEWDEKGVKEDIDDIKGVNLVNKEANFDGQMSLSKESFQSLGDTIGENVDIVNEDFPLPGKEDLVSVGSASNASVDVENILSEPKNSIACGSVGMVDIAAADLRLGDVLVPQHVLLSENEGIIKDTLSTHGVNVSVSLLQGAVLSTRIDDVGDEEINVPGLDRSVSLIGVESMISDHYPTRNDNEVSLRVLDSSVGIVSDGFLVTQHNTIKIKDDVDVPVSHGSMVINDGGLLVSEHQSIVHDHCKEDIRIFDKQPESVSTRTENDSNISVSTSNVLINDCALAVSIAAHDHDIRDTNNLENMDTEGVGSKVEQYEAMQDIGKGYLESESMQSSSVSCTIEDYRVMQRDDAALQNMNHQKSVRKEPKKISCMFKEEEIKESYTDVNTELVDVETQPIEKEPDILIEKTNYRADLFEQGKSEDVFNDTEVYNENLEDILRTENRSNEMLKEEEQKEIDFKANKDDTDSKSVQKRKDEGIDLKQPEPAKRVRRWSSGNDVQVGIIKPLTMETVKEITSPAVIEGLPFVLPEPSSKVLAIKEAKRGSSIGASSSPKTVANTKIVTVTSKPGPEANGMKQAIPAPLRSPTTSLKIERFVRPFTLNAVKEMLGEFGCILEFWMDQIKTHCYITYVSVDEATAARNGVYNKKWPPSFGNLLMAEFVDPSEVKVKSEGIREKTTNVLQKALLPPPHNSSTAASFYGQSNALPPLPPHPFKEKLTQVQGQKKPETQVLTLDDLFCKTKAKPHIYYLPLTDEQVSRKRSGRGQRQDLATRKPSSQA